ncbi:MAG: fructose-6-phosphate aldolase [Verrucomicrobiae bacterium]|nr:fructose-6-phosphate aldolase [Verrucomicrobiae bacterium]
MKLFIDSADPENIRQASLLGVIDGVTTNPTLMAQSIKKYGKTSDEILKEICACGCGPVSAEALSPLAAGMVKEGEQLAKIHKSIVIKLPMSRDGLIAAKQLREKNIPTNVTLIFSASQALLAAKAGAAYVSPFVGRLENIGQDGMLLIRNIAAIFKNYGITTKIIAASLTNPRWIMDCALCGADIATVPFPVFEQLLYHPMTDLGIEKFKKDWAAIEKK